MTAAEKWYVIVSLSVLLFVRCVTICVIEYVTICVIEYVTVHVIITVAISHMTHRHDDSSGKKDLGELTWEQREHVLRLLFSKMNSNSPPMESS